MKIGKLVEFFIFLADHETSTITIHFYRPDGEEIERRFLADFVRVSGRKRESTRHFLKICIPKILKLRDSRNKNKQPVGSKEEEVDVDKKKDNKKI